jgi:hypothetical protein
MKPINFEQENKILTKPKDMTNKECGDLPVFNDGIVSYSCWRANFRERLSLLLFGNVWVGVRGGKTQPPITIIIDKDIFK